MLQHVPLTPHSFPGFAFLVFFLRTLLSKGPLNGDDFLGKTGSLSKSTVLPELKSGLATVEVLRGEWVATNSASCGVPRVQGGA